MSLLLILHLSTPRLPQAPTETPRQSDAPHGQGGQLSVTCDPVTDQSVIPSYELNAHSCVAAAAKVVDQS